jgi:hypothetical protein
MMPILLVLLAGCGGFSNDIFGDDAEFRDALPSSERYRVTVKTADADVGTRADLSQLWMLQLTLDAGTWVNVYVQSVLDLVGQIRALPPSERGEDHRSWGPYDIENGASVTATIAREGGAFTWGFAVTDRAGDATRDVIYGDHVTGTSVRQGVGTMVLDFDAHYDVGLGTTLGVATIDYDNREGLEMRVSFDDVWDSASPGATPATAEVWYSRSENRGRFEYATELDVSENGVMEDLTVVTRWAIDGGGRADAKVTGGDAGPWEWWVTQCWSDHGVLVYAGDNLDQLEPVGDESACIFAERAEAEHL